MAGTFPRSRDRFARSLGGVEPGCEISCECRREKGPEETQRGLVGSTMDKKLFSDLVGSMQQHNEIIAGTRKPARATKVDAQSIKVLRAKAGLTQEKFAALIQVDLSTLRNWEQGRREPTGPAKALIRAITNDPKHVPKALEAQSSMRKAG
jgi:putative transcriptional regulator